MIQKLRQIAFLVIFTIASAYAQEKTTSDYVLLKDGTKIEGSFRAPGKKFKITKEDGTLLKIKSKEVESYNLDGEFYLRKNYERPIRFNMDRGAFMLLMETGKVTLYSYTYISTVTSAPMPGSNMPMTTSYEVTDYYLERSTKKPVLVRSGRFRKKMMEYFKDHKQLVELIDNRDVRYRDIVDIVQIYNGKTSYAELLKRQEAEKEAGALDYRPVSTKKKSEQDEYIPYSQRHKKKK